MNYKFSIFLAIASFLILPVKAQVTIGSEDVPMDFSILELTTKQMTGGLRLPQLTTSERDTYITPLLISNTDGAAEGLVIYNTTTNCLEIWNGYDWISLCSSTASSKIIVTPQTISLTAMIHQPAMPESVSVDSDEPWTLSSTETWLRLALNPDCSDAGPSVSGSGGDGIITVYLVVDRNASCTKIRSANITLGTAQVIKTVVTQGIYEPGGYSERITWDQTEFLSTGKGYVLTSNPKDAGLYFKFGSVVGVFSGNGSFNQVMPVLPSIPTTTFNAEIHVPWKLLSSIIGTGETGWTTIPYVDYHPEVIDENFHTAARVKAGLGDPCRLVGLDLNYIKNSLSPTETDRRLFDNGIWQLPTAVQNGQFTIGVVGGSSGTHWWTLTTGVNPSPYGPGVAGAEFPARNVNGNSKFLPANGMRGQPGSNPNSGISNSIQVNGRYWGNSTYNPTQANSLGFNSTSASTQQAGNDYRFGFGIRCVRQTCEYD